MENNNLSSQDNNDDIDKKLFELGNRLKRYEFDENTNQQMFNEILNYDRSLIRSKQSLLLQFRDFVLTLLGWSSGFKFNYQFSIIVSAIIVIACIFVFYKTSQIPTKSKEVFSELKHKKNINQAQRTHKKDSSRLEIETHIHKTFQIDHVLIAKLDLNDYRPEEKPFGFVAPNNHHEFLEIMKNTINRKSIQGKQTLAISKKNELTYGTNTIYGKFKNQYVSGNLKVVFDSTNKDQVEFIFLYSQDTKYKYDIDLDSLFQNKVKIMKKKLSNR